MKIHTVWVPDLKVEFSSISRGIRRNLFILDTRWAARVDTVKRKFSLSVLHKVKDQGCQWFTSVYGPNRPSLGPLFRE